MKNLGKYIIIEENEILQKRRNLTIDFLKNTLI